MKLNKANLWTAAKVAGALCALIEDCDQCDGPCENNCNDSKMVLLDTPDGRRHVEVFSSGLVVCSSGNTLANVMPCMHRDVQGVTCGFCGMEMPDAS